MGYCGFENSAALNCMMVKSVELVSRPQNYVFFMINSVFEIELFKSSMQNIALSCQGIIDFTATETFAKELK